MDFFKRSGAAKEETPTPSEPASNIKERRRFPRALLVPEVVEGNENADWTLREESISFQDCLMPPLPQPPEHIQKQDATPGQGADVTDAFAFVHRRDR